MENKPTIREEFFERWGGVELDGLEAEVVEWWLNKIKEVVGEEIREDKVPISFGQRYEKLHNIKIINEERQRILKEFGIIK